MENNYVNSDKNKRDIDRYFLKIAPDFSVLDLAEKYMEENNKTGEDKLFYFNPNTSSISTTFRRAIFRCNNPGNKIDESSAGSLSYRIFNCGSHSIFICISTTDIPIVFSVSNSDRIVGVCF